MTVYRVRFAPWVPFVDPVLGKDNRFHLGGVAKDVYDGMKIFMDFNYHAVPQPDNIYGAKVNGTWSGMIGSMLENETDISGPFFIDEDRSLAVEFTVPVAFSQLTIVSGLVSSNRDPFIILAIFSMPVWIGLFVTTLALSAVACFIYHILPARRKRTTLETYSKYLWTFHTGLIGKVKPTNSLIRNTSPKHLGYGMLDCMLNAVGMIFLSFAASNCVIFQDDSAPCHRAKLWVPFVDPVLGKDNRFHLGGVAKDVYDGMKIFMDFNYHAVPQPDNIYGAKVNGTWSGMIGSMLENETDISGPFFIDEDRSLAVEFTVPVAFSQLTIVSGLVSSNRDPFIILAIFSMPVWIGLFVTTLALSAVACFIYQILPARRKRTTLETYSKYLWTFQTGLIGKEFGDRKRWFVRHVWSSPSFRLLQSLWFTAGCLVFMYTYQGAIISAFSRVKLKPRISSVEELLEDTTIGISTFKNSYPMAFFKRLANSSYGSLWLRVKHNLVHPPSKGTVPDWLDAVEEGRSVFIADGVWLRYLIGERFVKTGKCSLKATDVELGAAYMAFAFRREMRNQRVFRGFNKGIRRFTEGNLQRHRLLTSMLYYEICTGETVTVANPLKLVDLAGAFIIFAAGNTLACILFILEIVKCSKRIRNKTK